jgi:hypothetical protein
MFLLFSWLGSMKKIGKKYGLIFGAVVIIVLASLTSVIGQQATRSSDKKYSPLFHIRTQRAADIQTNKIITSRYVGKGKTIPISLPALYDKQSQSEIISDKIGKMTGQEFERFVGQVISSALKKNIIKEYQIKEIVHAFNEIRNGPKGWKFPGHIKNKYETFPNCISMEWCSLACPPTAGILCFILSVLLVLWLISVMICA